MSAPSLSLVINNDQSTRLVVLSLILDLTVRQQISSEGEIVSASAYAIHRGDGSAKGDWDVGITIDVMEMGKYVDTVVLLCGVGDFNLLLKRIRTDYGVSTEVYGVPALTTNSLIDAASIDHRIEGELLLV